MQDQLNEKEMADLLARNVQVLGEARALLTGTPASQAPAQPDATEKFLADPANRLVCRAAAASDGLVTLPPGVSRGRIRSLMASQGRS